MSALKKVTLAMCAAATTMVLPAAAGAAKPEPKLTTSSAKLASSLHCSGNLSAGRTAPVLLVHGTSANGEEAWVAPIDFASAVRKQGIATCYVDLPEFALGDLSTSAEYVVAAIRSMSARAKRPIGIYAHSQGALLTRWALTYWPSVRGKVADAVSVAGSHHGTNGGRLASVLNGLCSGNGCPPAFWQQMLDSNLLAALNNGQDETPGRTAWTAIRTNDDDIVQPVAGSALKGASNILIQSVCPGRVANHDDARFDSVSFAALIDALSHKGPAKASRLSKGVCDTPYAPGLDEGAVKAAQEQAGKDSVSRVLGYKPSSTQEPSVPAYAVAAATPSAFGQAGRWITDSQGRVTVLRGLNMVNKIQESGYAPDAIGFGGDDASFLANNGFNVVRLGIIWKGLEPQPGVYDEAYLGRIEKTYEALQARGISVLLDFHQDMYNERFQGEGAPDWAVVGQAATEEPSPMAGFPNNYVVQDAVNHAYDAFWNNEQVPGTGRGVQEFYADAWAHVAKRFKGRPGIVGYNLMNEPWQGSSLKEGLLAKCATTPVSCGVREFEATKLHAFAQRVTAAIRGVDRKTVVWQAPTLPADFGFKSGSKKLDGPTGFAFNAYCGQAAGLDAVIPYLQGKPCGYSADLSFKNAREVSRRNGQALFMTEFGASDKFESFEPYIEAADDNEVSWTYWSYWNSDPSNRDIVKEGLVFDITKPPTGENVKTEKLELLARPYPASTSGTPIGWTFATGSKTLKLSYTPKRAGGGKAFKAGSITEIALPAVQYPKSYRVEVKGARVASKAGATVLRLALCPGAKTVKVTVKAGGRTSAKAGRCA